MDSYSSRGRPVNPNGLLQTGKQVHLLLHPADLAKLKRMAKNNNISVNETIRNLIRDYKEV
jgi:hypothetical protein